MAPGPIARPPKLRPELVLRYLQNPEAVPTVGGKEIYEKAVVGWLKANPGWTAKNWYSLSGTKGAKLLGTAGFYARARGNKWVIRNPGVGDKDLWTFSKEGAPPQSPTTRTNLIPKVTRDKGAPKPPRTAPAGTDTAPPAQVDPVLAALAQAYPGLDLSALSNVRVPKITGIDQGLAKYGAQPMDANAIDQLVSSIIQPKKTKALFEHDKEEVGKQTLHNIKQLDNWYGQVLDSQGVAAQRSADFGKAAVRSNTEATQAIISSLGGEANEGSYVVGAAGAENAGLLNALGSIENQYNADITPLLKAEAAGQKAREQAAGTAKVRDLSRALLEQETAGSAEEAKLRYGIWEKNQQILNDRITRRIGIIQANQGVKQQNYQNQLGLAQAGLAAQATGAGLGLQQAGAAAGYIDDQNDNAAQAARDAARLQGRKPKPYAQAMSSTKNDAWNDMLDTIEGRNLTPQQAINAAASIIKQYGWNPKSPGPQALIRSALKEAGIEV